MKTLNEYIIEGLLNKSNKNIDNTVNNNIIVNSIVNNNNDYTNKTGYIYLKSLNLEQKPSSFFTYKNDELNVNKFVSDEAYIVIIPTLEKQKKLLEILPSDFNLKTFNNSNFSYIYLIFDFFNTSEKPEMHIVNIDCNDFKGFVPQIFNNVLNIDIPTSVYKSFKLKNLQISAKESNLIFRNNNRAFDIFEFQNCNLDVKNITFLGHHFNHKMLKYQTKYCTKNFSDNIINNLSDIKINNIDTLKFCLGNRYSNNYVKNKDFDTIPFINNYLLETFIVWCIPQIMYLKYNKISYKNEISLNDIEEFINNRQSHNLMLQKSYDLFIKFINLPIVLKSQKCIFKFIRYEKSLDLQYYLNYEPSTKNLKFILS